MILSQMGASVFRGKEPLKFIWSASANKHPTVCETMTSSWTSFSMESFLSDSLLFKSCVFRQAEIQFRWFNVLLSLYLEKKPSLKAGSFYRERPYLTCPVHVFWTFLFLFLLCGSSHIHRSRGNHWSISDIEQRWTFFQSRFSHPLALPLPHHFSPLLPQDHVKANGDISYLTHKHNSMHLW